MLSVGTRNSSWRTGWPVSLSLGRFFSTSCQLVVTGRGDRVNELGRVTEITEFCSHVLRYNCHVYPDHVSVSVGNLVFGFPCGGFWDRAAIFSVFLFLLWAARNREIRLRKQFLGECLAVDWASHSRGALEALLPPFVVQELTNMRNLVHCTGGLGGPEKNALAGCGGSGGGGGGPTASGKPTPKKSAAFAALRRKIFEEYDVPANIGKNRGAGAGRAAGGGALRGAGVGTEERGVVTKRAVAGIVVSEERGSQKKKRRERKAAREAARDHRVEHAKKSAGRRKKNRRFSKEGTTMPGLQRSVSAPGTHKSQKNLLSLRNRNFSDTSLRSEGARSVFHFPAHPTRSRSLGRKLNRVRRKLSGLWSSANSKVLEASARRRSMAESPPEADFLPSSASVLSLGRRASLPRGQSSTSSSRPRVLDLDSTPPPRGGGSSIEEPSSSYIQTVRANRKISDNHNVLLPSTDPPSAGGRCLRQLVIAKGTQNINFFGKWQYLLHIRFNAPSPPSLPPHKFSITQEVEILGTFCYRPRGE